ncbi:MAG: hypothetical protein KAY32_10065 [Candidatus Eisenbacteria sp.]|nr:hypothetical protein [Candidatus Eisenbacteria bacterium]
MSVTKGAIEVLLVLGLLSSLAASGVAGNRVTIEETEAYIGQTITVNIFCHNEDDLFEYFNLVVFDDSKLEFVAIAADRGDLWYGLYPTHVSHDSVFVHGVAGGFGDCIDPDWSDPGSPLFHLTFRVRSGAADFAAVQFATEGIWDGHWNNCSGYQISPTPDYYAGGVSILGHAGHITIGSGAAEPGRQVVIEICMRNGLDVFEYFNQILFEHTVAQVDSIVPARGVLHYGYYPTHVSGDTIFVHGWAGSGSCFHADLSYPGAPLYLIHLSLHDWAPPGYTMPLAFLEESSLWNHWVGCDLYTTDSFTGTDGSLHVEEASAAEDEPPAPRVALLGPTFPNPGTAGASVRYCLASPGRVKLDIVDSAGRRLRTLLDQNQRAGWHGMFWDGTDDSGLRVPRGVYLFRLHTASRTESRKLVLVD